MTPREKRSAAAIERAAHAFLEEDITWDDLNEDERAQALEAAAAVLDASELLDDDYEQVGWQSTITGHFYRSDAPNRVPVFRKVSNTGEQE